MTHWKAGDVVPARTLSTIHAATVSIPDSAWLTHLQFRRFAGCPVCNLHLRSFVRRHDEITQAGVREVVFFHSAQDELLEHAADLPFAVIADPGKRYYAEFGAETGKRALFDPRAFGAIVKAIGVSIVGVLKRGHRVPPIFPEGGRYGLPADLLIDRDGLVLAVKYGEHADDQWSVEDLLAVEREVPAPAGPGAGVVRGG